MNHAKNLTDALFRVNNWKLQDALKLLEKLEMQLLKSINKFNDDLEFRIEKQEQYIDRLLSCNKFKKKR
jgi:hypothetical protein